jgi:hypothetical protein
MIGELRHGQGWANAHKALSVLAGKAKPNFPPASQFSSPVHTWHDFLKQAF